MFYLIELPILFFGFAFLWKNEKKKLFFITVWVLIVPLATMFVGNAHALRDDLMLPPIIILTSYALSMFPRKVFNISIVLILLQLIFVMQRVYFLAPNKFASFWSAAAKDASLTAIGADDKNKIIVLSTKNIDNIEYAYEVYAKVDPKLVISQYGKFPKVFNNVLITDK
jgi:hypothetical protein